jgi:hypothetical protein
VGDEPKLVIVKLDLKLAIGGASSIIYRFVIFTHIILEQLKSSYASYRINKSKILNNK